jgi:hypothetical protein
MSLTKLDIVEREIVAAVRLLFDGGDPIAVCLLASAARDITSRLCEQRNIRPLLDLHPHPNKADLYKTANRYSNFFKHARDDADAVLSDFDEREADAVLFIAVNDFRRLRDGMPIEARIFGMWFVAWFDPSQHGKEFAERLVGIETMPRPMQLALGKSFLEWAREQPEFREAPY